MMVMASAITIKSMKAMNPIFVAISVLVISIMSALTMFKSTNSSWMAFVLLLTFSSGMMTLFMYTASMSANEKTKNKKDLWIMPMVLLLSINSYNAENMFNNNSMKSFSNSVMMLAMATILILTMIALSVHGHHPNQTVSTSF